jgi:5-methylthioadenosine/S-adenosylhomocysteine deaminase
MDAGRLVDVGPTAELRRRFRGRRELKLDDHILMPGLINAHTHAAMSCFRGLGNDLPLDRWLTEVIFPAEARHLDGELVYQGSLLAAVEMLENGVTTFCDGYFFEEEAAAAARVSGIRAVLGQGVLDLPAPDLPDPRRARQRVEAFLEGFPRAGGRLRPSLFCHAPHTCRAQTLQWVKELCRGHALLFQIHLSETAGEVARVVREHGERPGLYLERLGLLDALTLCAHGVWLDAAEMAALARHGAGVAHAAESNMKLASGVAPVPSLLAAGVTVALGTDGCASNNDLDLLTEMDMVAKLHKVFHRDPVVCSAPQVLHMATRGGARAIGWEDGIGTLEPGKEADVIAIDVRKPHLTPLYDPISHVVYAASGSDVRYVWVAGDMVVAEGEVQTVSAAAVRAAVESLARRIRRTLLP